MKTLQIITKSFFIAASFVVLASCSKDDNPAPTPAVPYVVTSSVKGKVNGADFSSINAVASKVGSSNGDGKFITITGSQINANTMVIAIDNITGTGTFSVVPNNNHSDNMLAFFDYTTNKSYDTTDCSEASGTITVTVYTDTKIEGTFSFIGKDDDNCSDSRTITNGSFSATFSN